MSTKSTSPNKGPIENKKAVIGRGRLTTGGVRFLNLVSHNPQTTASLLQDFDSFYRGRRGSTWMKGQTGFSIEFELPDDDVLAMAVFNPGRHSLVHLPVWKEKTRTAIRVRERENSLPGTALGKPRHTQ
ncbi:hypothetical protein ELH80_13790 [Rhizobium ruizarguesonis]|uniref:hypothetical protein n=1 Tax=Rhizobium ruizarguesonis TaxID=2081791 RepID=UPI00102FA15D|nr:hypothetical protein [Rhizobium ruizarguesonis]TAZ35367.1 hypothetical protein ELH80_13790 [Rhizobium ruizarguesonis]